MGRNFMLVCAFLVEYGHRDRSTRVREKLGRSRGTGFVAQENAISIGGFEGVDGMKTMMVLQIPSALQCQLW